MLYNVVRMFSTGFLFNPCPAEPSYVLPFANSVDPDQWASDLDLQFAIKYVKLYQQFGSSNLIG